MARTQEHPSGSPATAVPTSGVGAAEGWYPDPAGRYVYRHWNGRAWADAAAMDAATQGIDPIPEGVAAVLAPPTGSPVDLRPPRRNRGGPVRAILRLLGMASFIAAAVVAATFLLPKLRGEGQSEPTADQGQTNVGYAATTAADLINDADGRAETATAAALTAADRSFTYVEGPSTGPREISVYAEPALWIGAALGDDGLCYFVRLQDVARERTQTNDRECAATEPPVTGWQLDQ